jgi:hypothetical protein
MHCTGVVHQNWLQMQKPNLYHNKIFRDKCINVLVDYDEKQLLYVSGKFTPHLMLYNFSLIFMTQGTES